MGTNDCSASVLVTGADRGLGLGFVGHYLQAGRSVIATSRRARAGDELTLLAERYAESLNILSLDVGDASSIAGLAETLQSRGNTVRTVICNAGVSKGEEFGQWSAENFAHHFLVNATGPALVVQAIEPFLENGAKVILISSGMGSIERNINPENSLDAYAASKCALNILSRRLAEKLRPRDMTVLSLDPGWVKTDMGGPEAPTPVGEAIRGMTSTIDKISIDDTGCFLARDGSLIPW